MIDRILNVPQVAEMLGCSEDTVRERTPHVLPGAKFGRDWVYVESQVIAAVSKIAVSNEPDKSPGGYTLREFWDRADKRKKPLPTIVGSA